MSINRGLFFFTLTFVNAVSGGLGMACENDHSKVIEQKVNERYDAYIKKRTTECRTALLADAEHMVDSILLVEAQAAIRDSLSRGKPIKPLKPSDIPPIDSLEVKPIFRQ